MHTQTFGLSIVEFSHSILGIKMSFDLDIFCVKSLGDLIIKDLNNILEILNLIFFHHKCIIKTKNDICVNLIMHILLRLRYANAFEKSKGKGYNY